MRTRFAVLTVLLGLGACSKASTESGAGVPSRIDVVPPLVSLLVGGSQQLTSIVYDARNSVLPVTVTYASNDTTIARVTATGNVTAVNSGLTFITITATPASATVVVNVSGAASLQLTPDSVFMTGTQTVQLTAVARDSLGNVLAAAPISYFSRDTTIVRVSATGLLTRTGAGTTTVVAVSGAARDSAVVTALVARVPSAGTPFGAAVVSASVGYVTLAAADSVQRLNLVTPGTTGRIGVGSLPSSVAINGAGTRAYVGNQGGSSVSVVNVATSTVVSTIPITGTVLSVLVVPGDSLLLVGTDQGHLFLVRLSSSAVIDSFPVGVSNALAMRGDTTVFASEQFAGAVAEINLRTRQVVRTIAVGGVPQGVLVSSSGTILYLANEIGQLQFWDLTTGTLAAHVTLPGGGGFGLAQQPATGLLFVSTSYYGSRVHVVDPATHQIVRVIRTGGTPRRIAFTPDGSVGIVPNEGGWVDYIR